MRQCDRCEAEGDETDIFAIDDRIWERYCEECRLELKAQAAQLRRDADKIIQDWEDFYQAFYS